jgi:hypothetical protein
MSEAEIQYHIPGPDRQKGDLEATLNAMGAFQHTIPFPFNHDYDVRPVADKHDDGGVMVNLVRSPREPKTEPTLLEYGETMKKGVETHFPADRRARLMGHFAGIQIRDPLERE